VYVPVRPARRARYRLRGLHYNTWCWGPDAGPVLLMLHGWADAGLTFQFVVDELPAHWRIVAPDWRGFGDSDPAPAGYWFPDYLADLDALIDAVQATAPVALVAHSMGGHIASLYAGARPERVRKLVNLEGFGLPPPPPAEAPRRYRRWLQELRRSPAFGAGADFEAAVARVRRLAPRLEPERARFVAAYRTRPAAGGRFEPRIDPQHKRVNPVLFRAEEFEACLRAITAPVLLVAGAESWAFARFDDPGARRTRAACYGDLREAVVAEAGHMLQHERPGQVAALIRSFLAD